MTNINNKIARSLELLRTRGLSISLEANERLNTHLDLIREWNDTVSLVSRGDLEWLDDHVADSLSLTPYIENAGHAGYLLDIGSGAGFPAIPLAIVFPEMRIVLIERSDRKSGFLRKVIAKLGLFHVELRYGSYPEAAPPEVPRWVTARAVEKPELVREAILERLGAETQFLCQGRDCPDLDRPELSTTRVTDEWSKLGLRRGSLTILGRSDA